MASSATIGSVVGGASPEAIASHYDLGNDFFALFQDRTRTYSCALYQEGDDLEAAQLRKYDWHAEHSGAVGAPSVLDVGCGWGANLARLTLHHGVARAVGLTLSAEQHEYIPRTSGVEVRLEGWAEHEVEEPYRAIISIGAFEHFARYGQTRAQKLQSYRSYFEKCRSLLERGSRMSLQTIAYGDIPRDRVHKDEFIAEQIFPESELPRLSDIAEAAEGHFEIELVRNDREHYARTCREWFKRLRENRAQAERLVGEDTVLRFERYLRTFSYSFSLGAFQLLRIRLKRIDALRG